MSPPPASSQVSRSASRVSLGPSPCRRAPAPPPCVSTDILWWCIAHRRVCGATSNATASSSSTRDGCTTPGPACSPIAVCADWTARPPQRTPSLGAPPRPSGSRSAPPSSGTTCPGRCSTVDRTPSHRHLPLRGRVRACRPPVHGQRRAPPPRWCPARRRYHPRPRRGARRGVPPRERRDLDYARARWETVTYLKTHGRSPPSVPARCVRRYPRWCKDGERRYGSAGAGPLPRARRGTSALGASQAEVLREGVEAFADDRRAGRVQAAYARLVALCNERNVHPPPSERTLRRALAKASRPDLERARRGSRAACQVEGPSTAGGPLFPPHGDRVFEVGYIDHTPLDIRLVSSVNGTPLGSLWLTLMIDAYSPGGPGVLPVV